MQESVTVSGIVTQGDAGGAYTESYKVKYSDNEANWVYVTGADGLPLEVRSYQDGILALLSYFPSNQYMYTAMTNKTHGYYSHSATLNVLTHDRHGIGLP